MEGGRVAVRARKKAVVEVARAVVGLEVLPAAAAATEERLSVLVMASAEVAWWCPPQKPGAAETTNVKALFCI